MRWPGESSSASVSPMVNPMRASLTAGKGVVSLPLCKRNPCVDVRMDVGLGCGLGRVPNRGSVGGGVMIEDGSSVGGMCQESSPARVSMSSTVRDGTGRFV